MNKQILTIQFGKCYNCRVNKVLWSTKETILSAQYSALSRVTKASSTEKTAFSGTRVFVFNIGLKHRIWKTHT